MVDNGITTIAEFNDISCDKLAVSIDTNGTIETVHYARQAHGIIDPERQGDDLSRATSAERNMAEKK